MTAQIAFSTVNVSDLVECENECGNMTHRSVRVCGECLEDGFSIGYKYQRSIASTRRFFNTGYGN
jgi:hypothetical protein